MFRKGKNIIGDAVNRFIKISEELDRGIIVTSKELEDVTEDLEDTRVKFRVAEQDYLEQLEDKSNDIDIP